METIKDLKQAEKILAEYIPQVRELLGKDLTLARMKPLMSKLGNPENKLKIIHIAGTSGKTSTAYYIAELLRTAGKEVGLTVSPHLDSVAERVQINLKPISDTRFCSALEEFLNLINGVDPVPTYFELIIAFVYWYFAKVGVDYAVIETGLGGLHDATNVAGNSDKICVITDIGFDHMQVLGNTLAEIASQKAGIIHSKNKVFTYPQPIEVMQVFERTVQDKETMLNVLSNTAGDTDNSGNSIADFQLRNFKLARTVYEYIAARDSLQHLNEKKISTAKKLHIPGRMDTVKVKNKTIVMDGAHNEQKMSAFVTSFAKLYPLRKVPILISLKQGKEYQAVLPLIKPICSQLITTNFNNAQDIPAKSIEPKILANSAKEVGFIVVTAEPDYETALKLLLKAKDDLVVITGSFYLLACVRPLIIKS